MADRKKTVREQGSEGRATNKPDHELLLAKRLSELEATEFNGDIPTSLVAQLLPEELEQFNKAKECLAILNQASADEGHSNFATKNTFTLETTDDEQVRDTDAVPGQIGRFQIREELGRGGFGIVLLAHDPRLDREIALKIPRTNSLLHPGLLKRFNREARAAALLSHPGIVPIFETDRVGPVNYIAYEFVKGTTLREIIRDHKILNPKLAAKCCQELADATQYAHSRGVIHRDLKPANIMAEQDQGAANWSALRITDFGLADLQGDPDNLTAENALVGTPAYMSPEQVSGRPATTSSDLYSLGVILYELLTGRVPFQGESHLETAKKIADEIPANPRRMVPTIPKDLSAICMKCLEKSPKERYATCQELADDLQAFLEGRSVTAYELTTLSRVVRWSRRNPLVSSSLAALFIVLTVGLVSTWILWRQASQANERAAVQTQIAQAKSVEALTHARMTREAIDQLYRAIAEEPAIHEKNLESFKLKLADSAQNFYKRLSESRPSDLEVLDEYVDTLRNLGLLLQRTGKHEDAIVLWREASSIVSQYFPEDLLRSVALRSKLSEDLINTGNLDEGVLVATQLVEELQIKLLDSSIDQPTLVKTTKQLVVQLINASQNLKRINRFTDAKAVVDEARRLAVLVIGQPVGQWPVDRVWARVLRCQTEIADAQNDIKTVEIAAPRAIQLYKELMDSPERVSESLSSLSLLHQWLANCDRQNKDFQQAILKYEMAGEYLKSLQERHPDSGGVRFNWSLHVHLHARVLWEAKMSRDGHKVLAQHFPWLEAQRKKYPQLLWAWQNSEMDCRELMGKVLIQLGELEPALEQFEKAIEICRDKCHNSQSDVGPHAFLGHLYCEKAQVYFSLGDHDEAKIWIDASIAKLEPIVQSGKGGIYPPKYLKVVLELREQVDIETRFK